MSHRPELVKRLSGARPQVERLEERMLLSTTVEPQSTVEIIAPAQKAVVQSGAPMPQAPSPSAGQASNGRGGGPLPNLPTLTQTVRPVVVFFMTNASVRQGQWQVPLEPMLARREEPDAGPLPDRLTDLPLRFDLPTERDIIAGMDSAHSLLTGASPQANLVPQPQDTVIALGALLHRDADGARKSAAGAKQGLDMRPFLISPVEDAVLSPPAPPVDEAPVPGMGRADTDAVDAAFVQAETEVEGYGKAAAALAIALASAAGVAERKKRDTTTL